MNPSDAVDVYVDLSTAEASVVRRRDLRRWHGEIDTRLIGSVVSEGLDPKRSEEVVWQSDYVVREHEGNGREIVVVWRQNHQTIVGTPFCPWGKAPNIILDESPRFRELGEAIIAQAKFSADAKIESGPDSM